MENKFKEKNYTLEDLNRAFNMGVESAVYILECSEVLSREAIKQLTKALKEQISNMDT